MRKEYREMFDEVHASERLRTEVMNMKRAENGSERTRRRVPAAALIAAALVVVLAGTALAVEYFGRVNVSRMGEGYSLEANAKNIPLSSLSEEVLQRGKTADSSAEVLSFDSWEEAETYLGLEIADNVRLDRMEKGLWGMSLGETDPPVFAPCLAMLRYQDSLPYEIDLHTSYCEGDLSISEEAVLMLEDPTWEGERMYNFLNPMAGTSGVETYVTPSGMEVTIITSHPSFREDWTVTMYEAEFILNGAVFTVSTKVNEGEPCEPALTVLKEVLDAYE